MALQKSIEQDSGFDATYWRITTLNVDWQNQNARVQLSGYKDEAMREESPRRGVMETRSFRINGAQFETYFGLPDLDEFPQWEDQDYTKGAKVTHEGTLYEATEAVSQGSVAPDENDSFEVAADLQLNRKAAYDFIKSNDLDFVDAEDV